MLNIQELLALRGLDTTKKIKLVRHLCQQIDIQTLYRHGHLETYQSYQGRPIFDCDFIVSFIGIEKSKAKLVGIYKIIAQKDARKTKLPRDFPFQEFANSGVYYDLEQCSGFEDLIDRVVIDWGEGTLAWHQWLSAKEVVEILPNGYLRDFPGYHDVLLEFSELVTLMRNRDSNREWHSRLSSVAGVYLIVDVKTGKQYVGSAYGGKGILGRWSNYANTGHGGNMMLCKLLSKNPGYAHNFQFSILQALDKSITKGEIIDRERFWKVKLGTRAFGLTLN